jgi:hypothetical protein
MPYDWRLPIPVMEQRDGWFTRVKKETELQHQQSRKWYCVAVIIALLRPTHGQTLARRLSHYGLAKGNGGLYFLFTMLSTTSNIWGLMLMLLTYGLSCEAVHTDL